MTKHTQSSETGRCPLCGAPVVQAHKPFCSKRCSRIDLHRWLGELYTLPGNEPPEGFDDEA